MTGVQTCALPIYDQPATSQPRNTQPGVDQPVDEQSGKSLGSSPIRDWFEEDSGDRQNLEVSVPTPAKFTYPLPSHSADPAEQDQMCWAEEQILQHSSAGDTDGPSAAAARKRAVPSEPSAAPAPPSKKTKITTKIIKKPSMKPGEGAKRKKIPQSAA